MRKLNEQKLHAFPHFIDPSVSVSMNCSWIHVYTPPVNQLNKVVALIYGKMAFVSVVAYGVNKMFKGYKLWQIYGQSNNIEMNGSDLAWNTITNWWNRALKFINPSTNNETIFVFLFFIELSILTILICFESRCISVPFTMDSPTDHI